MNIISEFFKRKKQRNPNFSETIEKPLSTYFTSEPKKNISSNEIIYIENLYYPQENKFIVDNILKIRDYYNKENKNFIYVPFIITELIHYYYPFIDQDNLDEEKINIYIQKIYKYLFLLTDIKSNTSNFCGLITNNKNSMNLDLFEYCAFPHPALLLKFNKTTHEKKNTFEKFEYGLNGTQFMVRDPWDEWYHNGIGYFADDYFNEESKQLICEVWKKVNKLDEMGISFNVLQKILSLDTIQKLSRIVITPDFKIFLPEFNNIEIVMAPLPKAVFLLFLKHPEGILFKKLHDYKTELKLIYQRISSREDMIKTKQSINNLANPTNNSINEKCSRIREAFVKHFDDNIAKYYYITGERAMSKKILIDRSLVEWQ
ncbi:MAG: hypothetical protein Q7U47_04465 [Paludibacter sp.]|nr:hypothetical protein [Paludibacter sp.]